MIPHPYPGMVIFSYPDGSKPESKILMLNRNLLYRTGDKTEDTSMFGEDEKPAQYVMSKRGNPLLVVDNYLYRKNGQTGKNGQQYWVCISPQCSVRTKTLNEKVNVSESQQNLSDRLLACGGTRMIRNAG